jgi:hypothetical protein
MTIKGCDISEVQQHIDFDWLVQQGSNLSSSNAGEGNKGNLMFEWNVLVRERQD